MQLGWIDFSKEDRQKALDVINLLSEQGAVDNSWALWITKKDTVNQPPIGYRVPASRHRFVQAQRNGGSENQSRRFIRAWKYVCSTTAFFFCRRPADKLFIKESGNVKLDLYAPTTLKYFPPMPFLLLIG